MKKLKLRSVTKPRRSKQRTVASERKQLTQRKVVRRYHKPSIVAVPDKDRAELVNLRTRKKHELQEIKGYKNYPPPESERDITWDGLHYEYYTEPRKLAEMFLFFATIENNLELRTPLGTLTKLEDDLLRIEVDFHETENLYHSPGDTPALTFVGTDNEISEFAKLFR